jgi:cytochrome P450 family 4
MEVSRNFHMNSKNSVTGFQMSRTELTGYVVISFLVVLWCHYKWTRRRFENLAAKMTGPPAYPIIGSGLEFVGTPQRKRTFI